MADSDPREDFDAAIEMQGDAGDVSSAAAVGTTAERIFRNARPYGDPIDGAIATGDLVEMRRTAAFAEEWLAGASDELARVGEALSRLRAAIGEAESGGVTAS